MVGDLQDWLNKRVVMFHKTILLDQVCVGQVSIWHRKLLSFRNLFECIHHDIGLVTYFVMVGHHYNIRVGRMVYKVQGGNNHEGRVRVACILVGLIVYNQVSWTHYTGRPEELFQCYVNFLLLLEGAVWGVFIVNEKAVHAMVIAYCVSVWLSQNLWVNMVQSFLVPVNDCG